MVCCDLRKSRGVFRRSLLKHVVEDRRHVLPIPGSEMPVDRAVQTVHELDLSFPSSQLSSRKDGF